MPEPKRALTEAQVSEQIKKTIFEVTAGDKDFSNAMREPENVPKAFQEFEKTANELFIEMDRLCCESEQIRDAGTNSAQNATYDNLKEQKQDVIEALNAMTTLKQQADSQRRTEALARQIAENQKKINRHK